MKQDYAPTQFEPQASRAEAVTFARKNLKLEQNLSGKAHFEVRAEAV